MQFEVDRFISIVTSARAQSDRDPGSGKSVPGAVATGSVFLFTKPNVNPVEPLPVLTSYTVVDHRPEVTVLIKTSQTSRLHQYVDRASFALLESGDNA